MDCHIQNIFGRPYLTLDVRVFFFLLSSVDDEYI